MFSLAASGDLRDVIRTVNALPETYTGKLTILLNDRDNALTLRNLLILLILGHVANPARAAELAVHLWYSAFVQASHAAGIMTLVLSVIEELKKPSFTLNLTGNSTLSGRFEKNMMGAGIIGHLSAQYDFEQAQKEYQRVL